MVLVFGTQGFRIASARYRSFFDLVLWSSCFGHLVESLTETL